jgi:aldose 1-epimerase
MRQADAMSLNPFGTLDDGRQVQEALIRSSAGAEARIIELGAVLRDLVVPIGPDRRQRVVLGFPTLQTYQGHSHHAGAIAGRYANRIAGGRFPLDGRTIQLMRNEGANSLHGGSIGFDRLLWRILRHDASSATLALESPDGDQGYPGTLYGLCRYEMIEPATLALDLSAISDAPTIVNLAQHSYFNLDGSDDMRDSAMMVAADFYTPVDRALIPTGEIASVADTPYDFRTPRPIRYLPKGATTPFGYDVNFVLRRDRIEMAHGLTLAHAVSVTSPRNGLSLEVWTTEPGLQIYDCHNMTFAAPGHDGRRYGEGAGLALEAQLFPDSPSRPHFQSAVLRPGEVYRQRTEYRFITP